MHTRRIIINQIIKRYLYLQFLFLITILSSCENRNNKCTVNNLSFRDITSRDIPLISSYQDLLELYPFTGEVQETKIVRPNKNVDTLQIYRYPELGLSYFRYGDSVQLLEVDLGNEAIKKELQLGCVTLNSSLFISNLLDFFLLDSSYIVNFYQEEIPYKDSISHPIFHAFDTSFACSSVFYFTPNGYLRYIDFSYANGGIYPRKDCELAPVFAEEMSR